jgi:F-type H+-transporting ATPase subunit b
VQEILGKIGFDWQLALINFVNIFIIFLILKRFAFRPIQNIIDKRKTIVEEGLLKTEQAEKSLLASEENGKKIILRARKEAVGILETATEESRGIVEEGKVRLSKEKDNMLKKAGLEIKAKEKESEDKLKEEAAGLIAGGVKKILGREVDKEMNERIINNS